MTFVTTESFSNEQFQKLQCLYTFQMLDTTQAANGVLEFSKYESGGSSWDYDRLVYFTWSEQRLQIQRRWRCQPPASVWLVHVVVSHSQTAFRQSGYARLRTSRLFLSFRPSLLRMNSHAVWRSDCVDKSKIHQPINSGSIQSPIMATISGFPSIILPKTYHATYSAYGG